MMCYSVMTQAYSEKEIPSSPNRSRTYDLPITSLDRSERNFFFRVFLPSLASWGVKRRDPGNEVAWGTCGGDGGDLAGQCVNI